jgi:predicted patatin/cPLA2 family phospholipase
MTRPEEYAASAQETDHGFKIQVTAGDRQPQQMAGRKLALICEGGGQRGIFTAGILDSFMQQKFFPFQTLLGVSAGAQNLTSYACDQMGYARDVILGYTTSKKFYDPFRFARGGHLVDLDWYFDAINQAMPLNLEYGMRRLKGREFHMCASRVDTLEAHYLSFRSNDIYLSIKASCALPLLYREPVVLDGVAYWDGGVADSLPVKVAHSQGSDCMVVIRSQPFESINPLARLPRNWRLKGLQRMGSLVESYVKNYCAAMDFIQRPPSGVKVIDIAPARPLRSRLLGSNLELLRHDYEMGRICGNDFMENHAWRL